jgi:hypothetical protein
MGINLKDSYRKALKGFITLPSKFNGEYIKFINDISNAPEITDVYFLTDNEYVGIYKPSVNMAGNVGFCNDY